VKINFIREKNEWKGIKENIFVREKTGKTKEGREREGF
jgi:hypothetical protein